MKNNENGANAEADQHQPTEKELLQIQEDFVKQIPELGGNSNKGERIIIYFHGNAEDIGLAFDLLYIIG